MADVTGNLLNSRIDRYEIRERIGTGGMARVFKAWDTNLERPVAIKILHEHLVEDPMFKERFEREAKFLSSINHPGIVQVYDFSAVERGGQLIYYMVMPYIPGSALKEVLEELTAGERLSHERVLEIMLSLSDALGYAHGRGLVHRDVKPGNVMFDEHGRAVLTDFGIARLVESSNLTKESVAVGTPAYMSPEQASGRPVDARTDIYALGVMLYELLAGQPPFPDDGSISVMLRHLNDPVPYLSPHLPMENPSLDAVVFNALAKSPEDRYQSVNDFAADLNLAFSGGHVGTTTRMLSAVGRGSQGRRYQSPLVIFAVGMAVIAFLAVVGLLKQMSGAQPVVVDSGVDSMTGDVVSYFLSTFDEGDPFSLGWSQGDDGVHLRQLVPGGFYHFVNRGLGTAVTTVYGTEYQYGDVMITMEGVLEETNPLAGAFGIVFRYVDEDNYNVFAVDGLGRYSIWVRDRGDWRELRGESETWTRHEVVQPRGESNRLMVSVSGPHLSGYVNDVLVTEVDDGTLVVGGVGIYLATTQGGSSGALVDSYQVSSGVPSMTGEEVPSMVGDEESTPDAVATSEVVGGSG